MKTQLRLDENALNHPHTVAALAAFVRLRNEPDITEEEIDAFLAKDLRPSPEAQAALDVLVQGPKGPCCFKALGGGHTPV